ncbi:hypothetical protein [Plasmodium yoelii yoelii]|uniref:Uncharacterized protein n=1 Tax=Plasmodium yoelii yoelii TaxID=73239 RepID=Q7RFG1_PLAYO|nr:hypothetical protein [Plasmodium yoelii yoelii]
MQSASQSVSQSASQPHVINLFLMFNYLHITSFLKPLILSLKKYSLNNSKSYYENIYLNIYLMASWVAPFFFIPHSICEE